MTNTSGSSAVESGASTSRPKPKAFGRSDASGHGGAGSARGEAGVGHAGQACLQVSELAEEVDGHAVLPAEVEGRRGDGGRAEHADRFEVVDGEGELAPIGGALTRALLGG